MQYLYSLINLTFRVSSPVRNAKSCASIRRQKTMFNCRW